MYYSFVHHWQILGRLKSTVSPCSLNLKTAGGKDPQFCRKCGPERIIIAQIAGRAQTLTSETLAASAVVAPPSRIPPSPPRERCEAPAASACVATTGLRSTAHTSRAHKTSVRSPHLAYSISRLAPAATHRRRGAARRIRPTAVCMALTCPPRPTGATQGTPLPFPRRRSRNVSPRPGRSSVAVGPPSPRFRYACGRRLARPRPRAASPRRAYGHNIKYLGPRPLTAPLMPRSTCSGYSPQCVLAPLPAPIKRRVPLAFAPQAKRQFPILSEEPKRVIERVEHRRREERS